MNPIGRMLLQGALKGFVGIYRLSNGRIFGTMPGGMDVLILKTTGKRSGRQREIPISFVRDGENYVIVASNGGQPRHPGWWHNLNGNPNAAVEIRGQTIPVTFRRASAEENERIWAALPAGYHKYQTKTTREIPLAILTPIGEGGDRG